VRLDNNTVSVLDKKKTAISGRLVTHPS
jgi:hypothetical protein